MNFILSKLKIYACYAIQKQKQSKWNEGEEDELFSGYKYHSTTETQYEENLLQMDTFEE